MLFVILEHQTPPGYPRGRHWDFMLEHQGVLRTWALSQPPQMGQSVEAEPLADHRLEYLDYEGPVSGGRGTVSRWDHGTYRLLEETPEQLRLELEGQKVRAAATLCRHDEPAQRWTLSLYSIGFQTTGAASPSGGVQ